MRTPLIALAVVAALAGVGSATAAPQGPRPGRPGPRPDGAAVQRKLLDAGLSQAQVDQIRKIHLDERKAAIRSRADLQVAKLELREMMEAPSVDQAAIAARVKQIGDLQTSLLRSRVDARLAARKVMTPEQFEKVRQMRHDGAGRDRMPHPRGPRRGEADFGDDPDMDELGDDEADAS
jgi:Spy/CpxP family protein refolding chaperone